MLKFQNGFVFVVINMVICISCNATTLPATPLRAYTPDENQKLNIASPAYQKPEKELHILPKMVIDGNLRAYYFDREYSDARVTNRSAFSLGGKLKVLTDPFFTGFRVGAALYVAQPLGFNSKNPLHADLTLPSSPVTTLGQAFLQYENTYFLFRLGDQSITTPWLNEADSRIIPATYQGINIIITPNEALKLSAMRLFRFKSRTSDSFTKTNLYNSDNIGGTPITKLGQKNDIGALLFGAEYTHNTLKLEAWAYRFYDFSNLAYGEINYKLENKTIIKPFIAAQLANQWSDGNSILQSVGEGKTQGSVFGAMGGAEIADAKITLAYNTMPKHANAFKNGDLISPYTTGYVSDPLFTSSMIAGLIEKAAGSAMKISLQYFLFTKQLRLIASYAKYNTNPYIPSTNESDFEVRYLPEGKLKNLSIRYRGGVLNGNPTLGRYIYHRIMFQYDFS